MNKKQLLSKINELIVENKTELKNNLSEDWNIDPEELIEYDIYTLLQNKELSSTEMDAGLVGFIDGLLYVKNLIEKND